ncbi:DUF397 domain-containing protein [Streptomyces sp. NPDC058221]|uniref:DUF397 domain-containing protein n=1 Tax=Streptomyces sp. NPDC058221 TaxID=3346388 RepID=UPI0036E5734F
MVDRSAWSKSSHSDSSNGSECVEVAITPASVHVRDSKNTRGPRLSFELRAWSDFTNSTSAFVPEA